jgi:hypothetical protein
MGIEEPAYPAHPQRAPASSAGDIDAAEKIVKMNWNGRLRRHHRPRRHRLRRDGIMCDKAEARRRLEYLAELGFDDILLVPRQPDRPYFYPADLSLAELVEIRDLIST